jgi:hypothetical protein
MLAISISMKGAHAHVTDDQSGLKYLVLHNGLICSETWPELLYFIPLLIRECEIDPLRMIVVTVRE